MDERKKGCCRWFSAVRGYGFLMVEGEAKEYFVHFSELNTGDDFKLLQEGDWVTFQLGSARGKIVATDVRRLDEKQLGGMDGKEKD